jgi:hypothetical protein
MSKNIPRGKDGRCVRVTTLPPSCAECLNLPEPQRPLRPVVGLLYLYLFTCEHVSLKKITTVQYRKAESVIMEWFQQKQALYLPAVFVKEYVILNSRNVSRSLINVKTCSMV